MCMICKWHWFNYNPELLLQWIDANGVCQFLSCGMDKGVLASGEQLSVLRLSGEFRNGFYKMMKFRLTLIFCITLISSSTFGDVLAQRDEYTVWPPYAKHGYDHKTVPKSLCNLDKEIISYTCKLVNDKIVSVCASKGLIPGSKGTGYIAYRYGVPDKIELVYPKKLKKPSNLFFYSNMWSHYETQTSLSFISNPYSYTVFEHSYWKKGKWKHRAGVSVRARGKVFFQKMCQGNVFYTTSRSFSNNAVVPRAGENFLFDYPVNLNLPSDKFVDAVVVNENTK